MRNWLAAGGEIPNDAELAQDNLTGVEYGFPANSRFSWSAGKVTL